jgi:formylglycine-generating enzyme required for sulfatase activity
MTSSLYAADPVVSNISAEQRAGTKLVDITYDVTADTPTVRILLEISNDGGQTFTVPSVTTSGAVGSGIATGTGKVITWNAGVDWNGRPSSQLRFKVVVGDLRGSLVYIPAGAFIMGRTSGDTDTDAPPVNVTLSQFYMGKYEVTKAEWAEVRTWALNNGYSDLGTGAGKANDYPVHTITWGDMVKWCNARSEQEKLTPCYTVSGTVVKTGSPSPDVNWAANGYRLPTEAEWEKAARGGISGKRFPWGTDTISHSQANYYASTYSYDASASVNNYHPTYATGLEPYTAPVGSFPANGYGLHDMAGNVTEWCWDWYSDYAYVNNASDPRGPAWGESRVCRGGGWYYYKGGALGCRAASRRGVGTSSSSIDFGFRVARSMATTGGTSPVVSSQDILVDIRNYTLSITPLTNGDVSGAGSYLIGTSSNLTATPRPGYLFGSWTGDASGQDNPLILLMDSEKTVGATFVEDKRDPDNDGLTNYQEIITHGTNPDLADTDGDGINDGAEVQQGRRPKVAEAVVSNLVAKQRTGTKFFDITYDLASTTSTVKMSLEISSDGGATYAVPVTSTTGAIGEGIGVGTGKSMTWNAGVDWDGKFSSQMRFRLIADNGNRAVPEGMALIPHGAFTMGDSLDGLSDAPVRTVTLDAYYMGNYEVTKAEWDEVRTWGLSNGFTDLSTGSGKASNHPVHSITWYQMVKWCNARSQMEGLTPVYYTNDAQTTIYKTGDVNVTNAQVKWGANGYRLPTEAEWEKAARGGLSGKRFPWGDTISHSQANYYGSTSYSYDSSNGFHPAYISGAEPVGQILSSISDLSQLSNAYTSPVGAFAANGYGLYDMAGNVWEWCWDVSGPYAVGSQNNPRGPTTGTVRIFRGGVWGSLAFLCRVSYRSGETTSDPLVGYLGLRVVRSSGDLAIESKVSANTNLDTRTWILTTSHMVNGSLSGAGSYLSRVSANVTASPLPGYLFGSWTGDASGVSNPLTLFMDVDKTIGATFVEDTRDPDNDGLTNYQEIITYGSNPDLADSDGDGLRDGEEKTRGTNPLAKDTDGDGLSDWEEEIRSKTNPLLADTDGDSISDALEDTDNDGISNLREVTELKTDPLLVDTDADGLSDTYELIYKGSVAAFAPRIGDRLRFELRELVPQGTLKLVGALPTGLSFNAVTGVLEGKLTGKAGLVKLSIQVLNGKTVIRTIPLQFTVLAFPSGLIGTWQVLLEDVNGSPQGMITTTISSPGAWTATYDSLGTKTMRSSKGVFDLTPAMDRAAIAVSFPVVSLTPAFSSSWQIDATTALASGTYAQGTLRGFRLAKTGELPTASRQITMVIDQGEQDGYQIPAGLGWATGTLGTTGSLPLSGQLGDAQSLKTTVRLSATGQAMMWVKPYRNLNSLIGGIISLRDTGIVPQSPYTSIRNGLSWRRVADNAELSYSSGFGPLAADASVNLHNKPTSSLVFSSNLGLSNSEFRNVVFDGGGLPSAEQFTAMPERFVMDSTYKLNPVALPGRVMALWQGGISASAGTFTGTIALDASNSGILKGNANVSGVVFRRNELETVGAGLIKIPTTGVKGSFRTGAFLMDR